MASPKTFNNAYELLKRIAQEHWQINSFYFGDLSEIEGKDNITYPLLLAIPVQSLVTENTINHTYRLLVADAVDKDEANENEVLSDTQSILTDVIKVLRYDSPDYLLLNEPVLRPFTEMWGDEVTGWSGEFEIEFSFDNSECNIPIDAFMTPGPTYGGAVATYPNLTLGQLSDVTLTNVTNGQVIVYLNGEWVNQDQTGGGGGSFDCEDLLGCEVFTGLVTRVDEIEIALRDDYATIEMLGDYLPLAGGTLDNGVNPVTIDFLLNPLTTQKINFGDDESLQLDARVNDNNNIANISLNTSGDLAITTYINDGDVWGTAIYSDTYAGLLGLQASKDADTTSIALQWNNITVGSSFATFEGIKYSADYSTNYTNRSLVDKEYVDNLGFNQSATTTLTIAASTAIDVNGEFTKNFSATTSLTAVTFTYSNFNDGSMFDIDLLKTTASNTVLTFPASSVISVSGAATVSGLTATLSSTTSGRFTITGKNMDGVYKIYITQDVL